jgi:uncharacterized protein YjiK
MRSGIEKYLRSSGIFFLCIIILLFLPTSASSAEEETYVFERMWPELQQPWYFFSAAGIASDQNNNIYVADSHNDRIQKLSPSGEFITKWGKFGNGDGEFVYPAGLTVDADGYVYVVDTGNCRIQKLTSDGEFIAKWGSEGSGDGEFRFEGYNGEPQEQGNHGIAIDSSGNIYVVDTSNHRVQKFTSDGEFIAKWGSEGSGDGELNYPLGLAIDDDDNVYVVDSDNFRVQKFDSNGTFITKWGSKGSEDGQFGALLDVQGPQGIEIDKSGDVYVVDYGNNRIQKFTPEGTFIKSITIYAYDLVITETEYMYIIDGHSIFKFTTEGEHITTWSSAGNNDGEFQDPSGISADSNGNIYAADVVNVRIQKFTSEGEFISKWGSRGSGDGQFDCPRGITIDASGFVYVVDEYNYRVQKFDSNGNFVTKWGSQGSGDGQFGSEFRGNQDHGPYYIAAYGSDYIYVTDMGNHRIQKFTSDGDYITQWGTEGSGDGQFIDPKGISVDGNGYVYVADCETERVQKFTSDGEFLLKWAFPKASGIAVDEDNYVYVSKDGGVFRKYTADGELVTTFGGGGGTESGQFKHSSFFCVNKNDKIYVSDSGNNRVQVFKKVTILSNSKAIIVAGGGPFSGNNLWDATQMSVNFAYRTLTYQGFTKESIYYLTSDTDLDLDSNGELDDVDADATNENLEYAINTWASDADNLILYLVDHGGEGTFRMSGTETLSATDIDSWLDQVQATIPGKVTVIYDACESGSFITELTPPTGKDRVVITSSSPGESAYFVSNGSISFSTFFWTHIFNGLTLKEAFDLATQSISQASDYQHPLLDANGNGTANEAEDFILVENSYIGNGTEIYGDAPVIGSVSEDINISDTSSATLTATGVTDDDGIARVWAVIRFPNYSQGSSDNPVRNLPSIDFMSVGDNIYEGTYDDFNIDGTYNITIYARDRIGNTSVPKLTTVSVNNPLRRKAIIVAGGPETSVQWNAIEKNADLVYKALAFQGYTDDDIYFMKPITISAGVDGSTSLSNLDYAINTWARDNTQDLVIYMTGNGSYSEFTLNGSETLTAAQLSSWLDDLQDNIPEEVIVIYDADRSGSFIPSLKPPTGKKRLLISGSSSDQKANFIFEGNISFSRFFWGRVLNGMNLREAFIYAKRAIQYCGGQTPQLDDNGNGIANEKQDGIVSRAYSIGVGIMLAGDDPVIGSVSPGQTISGDISAVIWAEDITTTGTIDRVWAVITPPRSVSDLPSIELVNDGTDQYQGTYSDFSIYGNYEIAVYAMDTEGNVSLPKDTYVFKSSGPDAYEDDDSLETADVIVTYDASYSDPQRHNFHDEDDQDWVKFYGLAGEIYNITTKNLESNCDTVIMIYDSKGTPLLADYEDEGVEGEDEYIPWSCLSDGLYYVMVKQYDSGIYGSNTGYDLEIYIEVGGMPGFLTGTVVNSLGEGVAGAVIKSDISKSTAMTLNSGAYIIVLPAGTHTISVEALDYVTQSQTGVEILSNSDTVQDFNLISNDTDEDGFENVIDNCPDIYNPYQADTDEDGTGDECDECPNDTDKIVPGICGCGVADTDTDEDGTQDCNDLCPNDPDKTEPGVCGCGIADTDTDEDGTMDCNDGCPNDPDKTDPGICGCGVADSDTDSDGTPDCNDNCPSDPNKTDPGACGCGVADTDTDKDGTMDCNDLCPNDPNKTDPGVCGCGVGDIDSDLDGTADCLDNCPNDPDKTEPGVCGCGVADTDTDNDGTADCNDNCPDDPDKNDPGVCGCGVADTDTDSDGTPDCNDLCPNDPDKTEPGICGCGVPDTDSDGDGTMDCTDTDDDDDGMPDDWEEQYGLNPLVNDADEDGDEDGYSNIEEYQAGTEPNDKASFPNQPPIADAGPDQTVDEGVTVTLDGSNSSDPDDGISSYEWAHIIGPSITLSDPAAITPTFNAPDVDLDGESLTFELTVTDNGGLQNTDTCIVNVIWVNIPPIADAGPDQTVDEGAIVTLDGSNSHDTDDGISFYMWTQLHGKEVELSNPNAVQPTFTALDVDPDGESLTFELTVTDNGGLQATDTCIVNVTWVNIPPIADAGPDQTVDEGDTVTLDGSNSYDSDDGIASYQWVQTAGTSVTLSDPASSQPTFTSPQVGTGGESLTFQLTVTDNGGLKSTDTCLVEVMETEQTYLITLNSSWNLISLCTQPSDMNIEALLDSIIDKVISVWAYENGSWQVYDPNNPDFSDLTTMEAGRGYWVNMNETATLTISGSTPSNSIDLSTGWNLVGYNSSTSQDIATALASIEGKYISVWAYIEGDWFVYDPNNPDFSDLLLMEREYGYWINAIEDCMWTIP